MPRKQNKPKTAIRYSESQKESAYQLFYEANNLTKVAEITGITGNTLNTWYKKFNWKQRRIDDQKYLSEVRQEQSLETLTQVKDMAGEIGLTDMDYKTFRDIRIVERMCIAVIQGDSKTMKEFKNANKPDSFKDAVDALKKCWDSKEKILARYSSAKKKEVQNEPDMVINNFFNMVKNTAKSTEVIEVESQLLSN